MNKAEFIKMKLPFNESKIGGISLNSLDELPKNAIQLTDIKDLYDYSGRIGIDIVFFVKNIKEKYYIELSNKNTNEEELIEHIKRGIIYW